MNRAEIYTKAADVIRINGHYKGDYFGSPETGVGISLAPSECPVCVVGAISVVVTGDPTPINLDAFDDAVRDLAPRIVSAYDRTDPVGSLADWNDADDRTAADVIAALELAAREVAA